MAPAFMARTEVGTSEAPETKTTEGGDGLRASFSWISTPVISGQLDVEEEAAGRRERRLLEEGARRAEGRHAVAGAHQEPLHDRSGASGRRRGRRPGEAALFRSHAWSFVTPGPETVRVRAARGRRLPGRAQYTPTDGPHSIGGSTYATEQRSSSFLGADHATMGRARSGDRSPIRPTPPGVSSLQPSFGESGATRALDALRSRGPPAQVLEFAPPARRGPADGGGGAISGIRGAHGRSAVARRRDAPSGTARRPRPARRRRSDGGKDRVLSGLPRPARTRCHPAADGGICRS